MYIYVYESDTWLTPFNGMMRECYALHDQARWLSQNQWDNQSKLPKQWLATGVKHGKSGVSLTTMAGYNFSIP